MLLLWVLFVYALLIRTVKGQNGEVSALESNQELELQCLQRDEDGDIEEDSNKQRIYASFLICNETGSPPTFHFRQSTSRDRIPCTVTIDDPTFHLFQAYLHHDFPLSCRLQSRNAGNENWAAIPINLIGKVEFSHLTSKRNSTSLSITIAIGDG